jgi:hypothetical protein
MSVDEFPNDMLKCQYESAMHDSIVLMSLNGSESLT